MPPTGTSIPTHTPTLESPPRPRWRRVLGGLLLAWLVLVSLGTGIHAALWTTPLGRPSGGAGEAIAKVTANVMAVPTLPGWVLVRKYMQVMPGPDVGPPLVANAISWGLWLSLGAAGLGVWRVVRGRPRRVGNPVTGPMIPSRRRFVTDAALGACAIGSSGLYATATAIAPWRLDVKKYTIPIRDLPRSLNGLRLVQLSDLHSGPRMPTGFLAGAVERAIALKPDLFLLTGDYIHNRRDQIAGAARVLAPLVQTATPVLGVLGNHDFYADGPGMAAALRTAGVRMIDNGRVFVTRASEGDTAGVRINADLPDGNTDEVLCIAGVGDPWEDIADYHTALRSVPSNMPRIVLSHQPDTAELPAVVGGRGRAGERVDLLLCGHTHGGQVKVPGLGTPFIPSRFGQKYAYGLVQGPACRVLVTSGIGMSLVPVRFNVPPEIVQITLVCDDGVGVGAGANAGAAQ